VTLFSKLNFFKLIGLVIFCAVIGTQASNAQCISDDVFIKKLMQSPELMQQFNEFNDMNRSIRRKSDDTITRIIPVVFHIIHTYGPENISRSVIESQLLTLNENFQKLNADTANVRAIFKPNIADMNLVFRLATKDPKGNCTDGVTRTYSLLTENARDNVKALIQWDPTKYFNVWVVNSIENSGGQGIVLGYAQFPFDNNNSTDGVVILSNQVTKGNKTLTHEVGHYLGLFHTFETAIGNNCNNNSCTTTGDLICDTPPVAAPSSGCPTSNNTCNKDVPDVVDQVENYMDYSFCSRMFSEGQKERMLNVLLNTAKRKNLWSTNNLVATGTNFNPGTAIVYCKPKADFYAPITSICVDNNLTFTDASYNTGATAWKWTFENGSPATSTLKNPTVKFTTPGKHNVKLTITNPAGTDSTTKTDFVNIFTNVSDVKSPYLQTFENPADLVNIRNEADVDGLKFATTTVGYQSNTSFSFKQFSNPSLNGNYAFELPAIDLTTVSAPQLRFRVAFRQKLTTNTDELRVFISTDCRASFSTLAFRSAKILANNKPAETNEFVPASDEDWKLETIDLKAYKSLKNLILRFEYKRRGGNNIYIDNININDALVGVNKVHFSNQFNLYPNPATNSITVQFVNQLVGNATITVYDISGKILTQIVQSNLATKNILLEDLGIYSSGIYQISVQNADNVYQQKLIVNKL